MNRRHHGLIKLTAAACLGCALVSTAAAEEFTWFGEKAQGQWMAGLKAGVANHGATGFDDATAYGLMLGYQFARPVAYEGKSAIEFEFLTTDEGDIDAEDAGVSGEWESDIISVFFAYRTAGNIFFKGKLGGTYNDTSANAGGIDSDGDSVGLGYGAGFGLRFGNEERDTALIELEFSGNTGDEDIGLFTLGGSLLF